MDEKNNEGTNQTIINIVKNDLGEEISNYDIDRKHRLGKRKLDNNVPRPIIVEFARRNVRNRIFKAKKKLKGKYVSTEKKREKCMILRICGHMTVKFCFLVIMTETR